MASVDNVEQVPSTRNNLELDVADSHVPVHAVQSPATELADLRTAMVVMQSSAADELREERQKHLDEVANLHRLLQEGQHEGHASLSAIEQERNEWSRTRACLLKEIEDLRGSQSTASMEAELLASRTEIARLKKHLEKAVEAAGPQAVTLAALLGVNDVNEANDESLKELERMDFERCQVSDLQMYMMALVTQKRLLQEDNQKLVAQLQEAQSHVHQASSCASAPSPLSIVDGNEGTSPRHSVCLSSSDTHVSSSGGDGGGGSVMSDGLSTGSCTLSSLVPSSLTVHRPSNGSADQAVGQRFSRSASESDISFLMQGGPSSVAVVPESGENLPEGDVHGSSTNDERHLRLLASLRDKTASLSTQLAESRTLCSNYEMQLQQAQVGTQLAVTRQRDLEQELDKCMGELLEERERLQRAEGASRELSDEFQVRLATYASQQGVMESSKSQLMDDFASLKEECQHQVAAIIMAKDKVAFELAELQEDARSDRASASRRIAELVALLDAKKKQLDEANGCLSQLNKDYQEQYAVTEENQKDLRQQLEHTLETLRTEQLSRHEAEQLMKLDILKAQSERNDTQVLLTTEQRTSEQCRQQYKDLEVQFANLQGKSKEVILSLQKELEEQKAEKAAAEERIVKLRGQLENLRQQLASSELVQQDFVRLSQNLQVQLAHMVDKQREIRWEHEDDVDKCRKCEVPFSVTRRKHHCRQCGKIFCGDCSSKTVPGGGQSQRQMRVCDACHVNITTDKPMQFAMDKSL